MSLTYFQFDSVNLLKKEIRITVRISFPAFLTSDLWYSFYTNVSRGVMSGAGTFEDDLSNTTATFRHTDCEPSNIEYVTSSSSSAETKKRYLGYRSIVFDTPSSQYASSTRRKEGEAFITLSANKA